MTLNLHDAEPIPSEARAEIDRLLQSGDLFRYTAPKDAPVTLLEQEFATMMGARYALAVSSCSAALFLSLKALDLPRDARVLIPAFTFAAVPSAVVHADCTPVLVEVGTDYRVNINDLTDKLAQGADAILISHMRGHTSDMDAILSLAEGYGIPVVEDAAHSLGTLWNGRKIGTLGKIGCFSFQSYKMINAGEGGIMITDDADLVARAIIMSGAYEHAWKKHDVLHEAVERWQNMLPLYNLRMQNLSAAVIRPQLPHLAHRVTKGRANHDYVAAQISASPFIDVPAPLLPELRAPDSLQFNLCHMDDDQVLTFLEVAAAQGLKMQVFGLNTDNARAFWNWQFLTDMPVLPATRAMLMRACDLRLPVRLERADLDEIITIVSRAIEAATEAPAAYGT